MYYVPVVFSLVPRPVFFISCRGRKTGPGDEARLYCAMSMLRELCKRKHHVQKFYTCGFLPCCQNKDAYVYVYVETNRKM